MAEVPNPKWYDEGTVALTQGSPAVTGTGTFWVSAGVQAGDIFLDADKKIYEITAVNDSTSLTLGGNYTGATGSGKGYSIIRVFNSTMNATLAKRLAFLLSEFEQRYDLDMQTVTPKSAYDIAKDNGFTGTEADWLTSLNAYGIAKSNGYTGTQAEWLASLNAYGVAVSQGYTGTVTEWLESLKAAGEWSTLDARTNILKSNRLELHNSIAGFRNKGTVLTDEHLAAIANKTFDNMFIGDYWVLNGHKYWIAKFLFHVVDPCYRIMMMFSDTLYTAPMNETDTNEGGYYNSWMYSEGLRQAGEILAADWGNRLFICDRHAPTSNASGQISSIFRSAPFKCMLPTYKLIQGCAYPHYPQTWHNYQLEYQLPLFPNEADNNHITSALGQYGFWLQECANDSDSFLAWGQNAPIQMKASASYGVRVIFFVK